MSKQTGRRKFLKNAALVASTLPILSQVLPLELAEAQDNLKPVDNSNPIAAALGYVSDGTKADTTKFPKRKGPEGEKQFCNNCMLFSQGGLKVEGHDGEYGKCSLFPQGLVNSKGWCNSWAAKPA